MGLYGRTLAGEGMGREEKIPKLIGSGSVDIRLLVTKIFAGLLTNPGYSDDSGRN